MLFRTSMVLREAQHLYFFVLLRVRHYNLTQKPVDLCFWQWICAFMVEWVLCSQHEEWLRQCKCLSSDRHLLLLHCLQECCLHLRSRSIYFVCQDNMCKQRSWHHLELLGFMMEHLAPCKVARQHIRRTLYSLAVYMEQVRKCRNRLGFCESWYSFYEDMSSRKQTYQ